MPAYMPFLLTAVVLSACGVAYWKLGWKGVAGALGGVVALGGAYLAWLRKPEGVDAARAPGPAPQRTDRGAARAKSLLEAETEASIEAIEAAPDVDALVDRLRGQS